MVRFLHNTLVVEIPCQDGSAIDYYEMFQEALCAVSCLVTNFAQDDILHMGREIAFLGSHLGPALAQFDPMAKKAIMGQAKELSDLQLTYEEWKQKHFSGMPDVWAKRFWLSYQTENNGSSYAQILSTTHADTMLENLSFSAIHRAFPELTESELTHLLQMLNKMTLGAYSSFADLHHKFPQLSEERLYELLAKLGRAQGQEDSILAKNGSAKAVLLEQITERLETLDLAQLQDIDSRINNL